MQWLAKILAGTLAELLPKLGDLLVDYLNRRARVMELRAAAAHARHAKTAEELRGASERLADALKRS